MPSPILARADALMQRRRQSAEPDDVPVLTDAVDLASGTDDDDVPVLFDIDPFPPLTEAHLPEPPAAAEPVADTRFTGPDAPVAMPDGKAPALDAEAMADEIGRRVAARLTAELPQLIAATVRDYLAEQTASHQSLSGQPD